MPIATHRPRQITVGRRIVDKLLDHRIPSERPIEPDGNIRQVAKRGRAMADLHVAARPLPRADAIEPVGIMSAVTFRQAILIIDGRGIGGVENLGMLGIQMAA